MGRRKRSIGIFPMREGFSGFTGEDVAQLEAALNEQISSELCRYLEEEMSGWLMRFDGYRALDWGAGEKRLSKKVEKSAGNLLNALGELGPIATVALDHFAYRHSVENGAFLSVLGSMNEMTEYLEGESGPAFNAAAIQIHVLSNVLKEHGITVTVTNDNYVTKFTPSPFVRFIDTLWEIEPRLRLFNPVSGFKYSALSQWVNERLREEPEIEKLVMQRRPKLK